MPSFQFFEHPSPFCPAGSETKPLFAVTPADLERPDILPDNIHRFGRAAGFSAREGELLLVPGDDGSVSGALFGLGREASPFATGRLSRLLPPGDWQLAGFEGDPCQALIGFAAGCYRFERYLKPSTAGKVRLAVPEDCDRAAIERTVAAIFLARDLINTPANDMQPDHLEQAFESLARHYGAEFSAIRGDDLLKAGFPLIHAVGRAGEKAPRLMELRWGRKGARSITLVGKGVCFDTGGLDIKSAAGMGLMKKDMGGAANVMGLALMIMDAGLDVDLRVIVPSVENSIAGNAFRPGDIYRSRKGLTVQIDNTDAEGRLILADALTYADEELPDLLIDMATLTGAARVALGPDIAPFFTDSDAFADKLQKSGETLSDPLWRMPLFAGYDARLKTAIADLTNAPAGGMAGAITAALFLKRFVGRARTWAHFDIYGHAPTDRDFGPAGGEAQAIRALFETIRTS
ncbi:leucyl aminopeptidase family protein [Martelella lutilitoris]|uniref:Leucyl aminopeptidase family protein n=1 Tax=Martelella lutilitoris TaxID=2583532 RepID=A0A5C4JLS3_9HYPH|nr:leucyl aminopeptidase family protein [Martelella lutilitoris]TNB46423.1 leucyl aminopeptidase family protein [Martelella lutilitoris]